MSFLKASTTFTRFRLLEPVPVELWPEIPAKLKKFAFQDIDELAVERAFGWTNFDDLLDTEWQLSPPEKADYITFSLRLDTRRIPPAVLLKHTKLALRDEEARAQSQGRKFVGKDRRKEISEQVKLRLMGRFLPIPAHFQVVWNTETGLIYFASTQRKVLDLFQDYFVQTFDLHLEQLVPYSLALQVNKLEDDDRLDNLEATDFR